jgi:hypothetical protein
MIAFPAHVIAMTSCDKLTFGPKRVLWMEEPSMADEQRHSSDEIDLGTALGSDGGVSAQCFAIYIPNKDREGREIGNQRKWALEAIGLLSQINGGASAMPPVEGAWLNDTGTTIWENPVVVYSFVRPKEFIECLPKVREFLHRMGRETNQGEIAFEFDGQFHRIRTYDAPAEEKT